MSAFPAFLNPSAVVARSGGRAGSSGRRQQHPQRHLPLGGEGAALLSSTLPGCWAELGGAAAASLRDGSGKKAGGLRGLDAPRRLLEARGKPAEEHRLAVCSGIDQPSCYPSRGGGQNSLTCLP